MQLRVGEYEHGAAVKESVDGRGRHEHAQYAARDRVKHVREKPFEKKR